MNLVTAFHSTQDPISGDISPALGREESGAISVAIADPPRFVPDVSGTIKGFGKRGWDNSAESADRLVAPMMAAVRRLTPVECERLQGFPDNWTRLDDTTPDSRRYAALGDAVTVNVARWIGQRLAAFEERAVAA